MELGDTSGLAAVSAAVAYAMVALGLHKRVLVRRRRRTCPSCRADVRDCRCRRR